jgi:hypothetical protein
MALPGFAMMAAIRAKRIFSSWTLPRRNPTSSWQPHLPLPQALEWIVEWYRAFQAGADLRRLTQAQIRRYEALLQP